MSTPLRVSVIIPTYNRPKDVLNAVDSALNQSRQPNEIIIVNDGCDNEVLKNLQNNPIVTVINNETSRGANYSRNRGAKHSSGDVLMFLDDDDTWEIEKVQEQITVFKRWAHVDLVFSGRLVVYAENRDKVIYKIAAKVPQENYFKSILEGNFIGTTSSVAIRRETFFQAGMFDESLPAMQDYDLWIRVCKIGEIQSDEKFNVRYTISMNKNNKRISNSGINQITAAQIMLKKYESDFIQAGINLRSRKSRFFFYIAKSIRENSLIKSLPWIIKSFILFPNLKSVYLLFSSRTPNIRLK